MKTIFGIMLIATLGAWLRAEGLSKSEAEEMSRRLWQERVAQLRAERAQEMSERRLTIGQHTMRFLSREIGDAPKTGRPLVISLHGGGNAPAAVNDSQWQNQIRLYSPEGSLYVAPRAPTDTWNLWHESHIDALFDRLIENCVAIQGVDPERVYLMGYSAGGDGVYQLAPRMADRFAAAAMMAGHPNEAKPDGLRNLPFALLVGGQDAAFQRNQVAAQWAAELDRFEKTSPGEYRHFFRSYPECGHWMNGQDAEAVPWMLEHRRMAWPKKVTWLQDDSLASRFYWLSVDLAKAKAGDRVDAECRGQRILITSQQVTELTLRLSDELLSLDQAVEVVWNGKQVFHGKVVREEAAIRKSLAERGDAKTIATALVKVKVQP
ncbi:MAG: alpha/beta hydrolase [Verrucomicrobia bacterium]|nr:MAG: alpha/beta hydrolase [Verrucomicrobiota bacterium]